MRSRVLLSLLLLAIAAFAIRSGPAIWWRWTHERVYGHPGLADAPPQSVGWATVVRGKAKQLVWDGPFRYWHADTGFVQSEGLQGPGLTVYLECTQYDADGRVRLQVRRLPDGSPEVRESSPWWWDARDQEVPSAPWLATPGKDAAAWLRASRPRISYFEDGSVRIEE